MEDPQPLKMVARTSNLFEENKILNYWYLVNRVHGENMRGTSWTYLREVRPIQTGNL